MPGVRLACGFGEGFSVESSPDSSDSAEECDGLNCGVFSRNVGPSAHIVFTVFP